MLKKKMTTIEKTEIGEKIYEFKFKQEFRDLVVIIYKPNRENWKKLLIEPIFKFSEFASPLQVKIAHIEFSKVENIFTVIFKYIDGTSFEVIFDYKEFEPALKELNLWLLIN